MRIPDGFDCVIRYQKAINLREKKRQKRRKKVQALLNNSAATDGEKEAAKQALLRIDN